jgi:hypothetical protein
MKTIVIIIFLSVLSSCNHQGIPNVNIMPGDFMFVCLDKNNEPLIKDTLTKIDFFYFSNGQKKEVNEYLESCCKPIKAFDAATLKYHYYYNSLGAPLASGNDNIKTFYLTIGNKTDTIYLDVEKLAQVDPQTRGLYRYNKVTFNGKEIVEDKDVMPWVYVLKR